MEYNEASTPKGQDQIKITIEEQERGLDDIHAGAIRLKHHATAVNSEVKDQNNMISDLDENVDRARHEVQNQATSAKGVNASKKKLCFLYCIIAILVFILIIVASIPDN